MIKEAIEELLLRERKVVDKEGLSSGKECRCFEMITKALLCQSVEIFITDLVVL